MSFQNIHDLFKLVDDIKINIPEQSYILLCNKMKDVYTDLEGKGTSSNFLSNSRIVSVLMYEEMVDDYEYQLNLSENRIKTLTQKVKNLQKEKRKLEKNRPFPPPPPEPEPSPEPTPVPEPAPEPEIRPIREPIREPKVKKQCPKCNTLISIKSSMKNHQKSKKCQRISASPN